MIRFFVPGRARTEGSTRAFKHAKTGKVITRHDNRRLEPWRQDVKLAAQRHWKRNPSMRAFRLDVVFYLPRPKAHFRTGRHAGELKPWAVNERPTGHNTGDRDKLLRAIQDAMEGVVWLNDSQVVEGSTRKEFAPGSRIGVEIEVGEL